MRRALVRVAPLVAALVLACGGEAERRPETVAPLEPPPADGLLVSIDPPAAAGAFAPNLAIASGRLVASWLEEVEIDGEPGHRLVVSRLEGAEWSPPAVVAAGADFFANWADFPAVVEAGDGSLLAHWLEKTGAAPYAYSIALARSLDGGAVWAPLGWLNDDATPTEHGFVSWLAEGDGARAFWLDGREMAAGGAMTLTTARVGAEIGPARVLDERVCECCATGAARTGSGPLVVYRDRDGQEIRDIAIVRLAAVDSPGGGEDWSAPAVVAADGWKIPGCPVNGPRVAAAGQRVAVAWFTAAGAEPRVKMAFSHDGGAGFDPAITLDDGEPLGRADLELDAEGAAWVVWLTRSVERAAVVLARVTPDGPPAAPLSIAETDGGRTSGFPRLARIDDRLFIAWVEIADGSEQRLRVASLRL